MRQLRFRIWHKIEKRFLESFVGNGDYEYTAEAATDGQLSCVRRFLGHYDGIDPDTVIQQFTGLFDKKGNRVFEGDIILLKSQSKHEVEYSNEEAAYVIKGKEGKYLYLSDFCDIEVVGNIFTVANN